VVLYWYQSHDRVIASEFAAKFWLIADSIRYRRSDTALVKVVVPVNGSEIDSAVQGAVDFVQSAYPAIARQLPT
jgi:EpsI family protein